MVTQLPVQAWEGKRSLRKGGTDRQGGSYLLSSGSDDPTETQSPSAFLSGSWLPSAAARPQHSLPPQERAV